MCTANDAERERTVANVLRCESCATTFLGTVPDNFDDELYSYYEKYTSSEKDVVFPELNRLRNFKLLDGFGQSMRGREFIDVGCGLGGFVEAALASGWRGYGIDLAETSIRIGAGYGLPLRRLDFFSTEILPESVDLVTMFEFIEHVARPGDFLRRAEEVLRPGGLLYLTTPNFNSIDRVVLKNEWEAIHVEHLSYFTPETLASLVRRATRMKVVEVNTKNVSAGLLRKLFLTTPTSAQSGPKAPMDVRHGIEASPVLRFLKGVTNRALNATKLGSSMTMTLSKPPGGGVPGRTPP